MDNIIVSIVERLGLLGIAVLMMLENIFPPMPSEAIMGSAALAIERGTMSFWGVLIAGTIGTVAGNWFWFALGDRLGYERMQPFVDRWGRWLTLEWDDVERASRFFRTHGHWVVLFLRTTPFLRTMISLPAGLAHMGKIKFLVFTAIGSACWNVILILGTQWLVRRFEGVEWILGAVIIGMVVLSVIAYIWRLVTWKPRGSQPD